MHLYKPIEWQNPIVKTDLFADFLKNIHKALAINFTKSKMNGMINWKIMVVYCIFGR